MSKAMNFEEARVKVEELVNELNQYSYEYYVLDAPTISDQEYDQRYRTLLEIEEEYPELVKGDSPTQRVGDGLIDGFQKVEHSSTYEAETGEEEDKLLALRQQVTK